MIETQDTNQEKFRFSGLNLRKRGLVTAVMYHSDEIYLDRTGVFATFEERLYLHIKREGYPVVVLYNTAFGFYSYKKADLEAFLADNVAQDTGAASPDTVSSPVIRGARSGKQIFTRRKPSGDNAASVNQTSLQYNIVMRNNIWMQAVTGHREANQSKIINRLETRDNCVIIFGGGTNEFDENVAELFAKSLERISSSQRATGKCGSKLIVTLNVSQYGSNNTLLFNDTITGGRSIFVSLPDFRNMFIRKTGPKDEDNALNTDSVFVTPPPTMDEIKKLFEIKRYNPNGLQKRVDWENIDSIMEQILFSAHDMIDLREDFTMTEAFDAASFNKLTDMMTGGQKYNIKIHSDSSKELESLVGLQNVKSQINKYRNKAKLYKSKGILGKDESYHLVFTGNPGTGKTTVARIVGAILKDMGVLKRGHVVETDRAGMVAEYVGHTAIKTNRLIDAALDGVLFIDEAYTLASGGGNDFGQEAIDTLLKRMEDDRSRLVVIVAGYPKEMKKFIESNSGLQSRFPTFIDFEDYNAEELEQIFMRFAGKNFRLSEDARAMLKACTSFITSPSNKPENFANGRWARNLFDKVVENYSERVMSLGVSDAEIEAADFQNIPTNVMARVPRLNEKQEIIREQTNEEKLMDMVGLQRVKDEILQIRDEIEYELEDDPQADIQKGLSYIFAGSPGTGKTTVARLLGAILRDLGALSSGHTVECSRSDLVGQYLGQTAPLVKEVFDRARGGVLFIDEIYGLVQGNNDPYGNEALTQLVTLIENNRHDIAVVLAGYKENMEEFLSHNVGLKSRFKKYLNFDNYSAEEVYQIASKLLRAGNKLTLSADAEQALLETITAIYDASNPESGNGRWARNLADYIASSHKTRIMSMKRAGETISAEIRKEITFEDILGGRDTMISNSQYNQ